MNMKSFFKKINNYSETKAWTAIAITCDFIMIVMGIIMLKIFIGRHDMVYTIWSLICPFAVGVVCLFIEINRIKKRKRKIINV